MRRLPSVLISKLRYPPDSGSMALRLLVLVCRSTNEFLYVHPVEMFENNFFKKIFFNYLLFKFHNFKIKQMNRNLPVLSSSLYGDRIEFVRDA